MLKTARLLFTLVFLAGSSIGHAGTSCELALAVLSGPLTPSKWLLAGDSLARRVVAAPEPRDVFDETSIWLEYQRDARYKGRRTTELDAFTAVIGPEGPPPLNQESYAEAGVAPPGYFVTWSTLGVRAINRMLDARIYPIGLVDKNMAVDGQILNPTRFQKHDEDHVVVAELMRTVFLTSAPRPQDAITREFFGRFRYDGIVQALSPREHMLFDLAYFFYFHEQPDLLWAQRFGDHALALGPERIDAMYPGPYAIVDYNFEHRELKSVTLAPLEGMALIRRFLDPGDLWVNLPVEIKAFCKAHPARAELVVEHLLEEAMGIFFRVHFNHARQLLVEHSSMAAQ